MSAFELASAFLAALIVTSLLLFPVMCVDDALPHSIFMERPKTPLIHLHHHGEEQADHHSTGESIAVERDALAVRSMPSTLTISALNAVATLPANQAPVVLGEVIRLSNAGPSALGVFLDVPSPPPRL